MKLWRKVSRETVFRMTAEEWSAIATARIANKGWKKSKIRWAEYVEDVWDRALYLTDPTQVIEVLEGHDENGGMLGAEARRWERKWQYSLGLTTDDFAAVFREELLRMCKDEETYFAYNAGFYIIETIQIAWRRRAVDLVRSESTKQRQWERGMTSLDKRRTDPPDLGVNVEYEAVFRSLLDDPSITEAERRLMCAAYSDPRASNMQLANLLGYPHPEKVRRMKERIREKLSG